MINNNKKAVGIDMSDHSIEIVELEKAGDEIAIANLSRKIIPAGIVVRGRIKNKEKLSALVIDAMTEAEPRAITPDNVIFGLPESHIYTYAFKVDSTVNIDEALEKEIKDNIPLEHDDLLFRHRIIKSHDPQADIVLVIATSQTVVNEWRQFFRELDIDIDIFDMESAAILRGLFKEYPREIICLLDIGAYTTNITIFDEQGLIYSYTVNCAGNHITNAIAKKLKIKPAEAEKLKINFNPARLTPEQGAAKQAIEEMLKFITDNIKNCLEFFSSEYGKKVGRIILTGGTSKLAGLEIYLKNSLKLNLAIAKGSTWLISDASIEYIEAIGLALRQIDNKPLFERFSFPGTEEKDRHWQKPKFTGWKLYLGAIILLAGGFYLYSNQGTFINKPNASPVAPTLLQKNQFTANIPVLVDAVENAPAISGRIISATVDTASDQAAGKELALGKGRQMLAPNEAIWPVPVNEAASSSVIFPYDYKFLAYDQNALRQRIENMISDQFASDYSGLSIAAAGLTSYAENEIYILAITVNFQSAGKFDPEAIAEPELESLAALSGKKAEASTSTPASAIDSATTTESVEITDKTVSKCAKKLTILVLNGSGRPGDAGKAAKLLTGNGYKVSGTTNAQRFDYQDTVVEYQEPCKSEAEKIGVLVGNKGVVLKNDSAESLITVITGDSFK